MVTIKFNITNNAWVNNGLVRLIHEMKRHFSNEVSIKRTDSSVELSSNTNEDIYFYLNEVIKFLAAYGTYNYAQVFKIINKEFNGSYTPPSEYPHNKGDAKKKTKIPKDLIDRLKKSRYNNFSSSEQNWKMRMSYLGSEDNYLKLGLNFNETNIYNLLKSNDHDKNICPTCGYISKNMVEIKQFFNPLLNEHHNNEIEGFSRNFRKKLKFCPNCATLAFISLFDKFIPFYWSNSRDVILALPNVYNLEILEKIANNLSLSSQFIDFSDSNVTNYNTNIINFTKVSSNSAALLSLLHNIMNNFSKDQKSNLFQFFKSTELIELVDWIFITKDSFKIKRIKANEKVFNILKVQTDPNTGEDIYLVNDYFNRINFKGFSPYQIDKFFKSFLYLNHESIAQSLFDMVKFDIRFYDKYYHETDYPIFLFNRIFLNLVMGEIIMLDDEFKKSCKSIAETIGSAFYKDIGLMSKFAYATDTEVFKEHIEESFFLMAKRSSLDSYQNFYSNSKELEIFFDGFNEQNFKETKSYFVSFMSSSALYQKHKINKENKNNNSGEN